MTDEACDVAVVGLGAMGAQALWQLARRGLAVVGIDRHPPPHVHGSTHGESRITRIGVGEGDALVPLARRSHAIWRELEAATGAALFTRTGALVIGRRGGFVDKTIAVASRNGVPHEVLDAGAIGRRFPQHIGLGGDEIGYLEPDAGFLRPEACVEAALAEAARAGAVVHIGAEMLAIEDEGSAVRIRTTGGTIRAARAVVAAGAWTAALLGPPFDTLLTVTRQTLFWFAASDPAPFAPAACPVYIRGHGAGDDGFYGFPIVVEGGGVKLATEGMIAVDPARYRPGEDAADAAAFYAAHVAGRLAGIEPTLVRRTTCLYTSTADGRFLIGRHPAMPAVTVVSACSGHGFKHSAAIGELVAGRVCADLRLAPFALP